jgi:hypothetical protein
MDLDLVIGLKLSMRGSIFTFPRLRSYLQGVDSERNICCACRLSGMTILNADYVLQNVSSNDEIHASNFKDSREKDRK